MISYLNVLPSMKKGHTFPLKPLIVFWLLKAMEYMLSFCYIKKRAVCLTVPLETISGFRFMFYMLFHYEKYMLYSYLLLDLGWDFSHPNCVFSAS